MMRHLAAFLFILLTLFMFNTWAEARDAAFLDPGASGGAVGDGAIRIDPKSDIDVGETALGVAKRVSVFFVNQTNIGVKIEKMAVNGDGNVTAEISSNDCMKQQAISPLSRCNVEVSITPSSPGSWNADLLMTHDGAGRIARAHLSGKTSGSSIEKKDNGLALSSKEVSPVTFGDVEVGGGKAVRSALMVNDSLESITLYAIDVIEADNGLQKLEQGCAVDMELKPGESCPVTLLWAPSDPGQISTDLIIRHSGRLGFAVIPIRGTAKGTSTGTHAEKSEGKISAAHHGKNDLPPPPSPDDITRVAASRAPAIDAGSLAAPSQVSQSAEKPVEPSVAGPLHLIGTVGNRALILKPGSQVAVVNTGDTFDVDGHEAKLIALTMKSAELTVDGKKRTLPLEAASELTNKANSHSRDSSGAGGKASQTIGLPPAAPQTQAIPNIGNVVPTVPLPPGGNK